MYGTLVLVLNMSQLVDARFYKCADKGKIVAARSRHQEANGDVTVLSYDVKFDNCLYLPKGTTVIETVSAENLKEVNPAPTRLKLKD